LQNFDVEKEQNTPIEIALTHGLSVEQWEARDVSFTEVDCEPAAPA
jgi:hypothetical protein